MKKLISTLASIPFSIFAQQFPEVPMCFQALKTILSLFAFKSGFKTLLAMDMRTHACAFNSEKPIVINRVGCRAWMAGITYRISLWELGEERSLGTCLVCPGDTNTIEFFSLKYPVAIQPGKTYYITRTYVSGGLNDNATDHVGWLSSKDGGSIYPIKQQSITLIHGFFSDDEHPLQSDSASNIRTSTLLPFIDFEYTLQCP
ncbi:hypothetical protein [Pedobacter nyackensis]|uniref:DUF4082 domain-containing protein n=1 Tax=Pedobacter nyackensis TaxID=475255 RepID=A0A1W2AGH3_9SPHI|nr:hypothetical protein [Pedobacter nyackensis]SMC59797.1 hypothetical protein SAMN04488101_101590 [Pedobacter nyackensis]